VASTMYALQVIEGRLSGTIYELPANREFVLGRGSQLEIVIDEDMVSRRHAKITTYHDSVVIQDLNSTNGTLVNQQQITGGYRLNTNDEVTIGSCVLRIILQQKDDQTPYYPMHQQAQIPPSSAPILPSPPQQKSFTVVNQSSPLYGQQPPAFQAPVNPQQIAPNFQMPQINANYTGQPQPAPAQAQGNFPQQGLANFQSPSFQNQGFNAQTTLQPPKAKPRIETGDFPNSEYADTLSLITKLVEKRHDGVLEIIDEEDREANVYFRSGHLYFVSLESHDQMLHPNQALNQIACWMKGKYKIKPLATLPSFEIELNGDSRVLIEQARKESLNHRVLRSKLPPFQSVLKLILPLESPLTALNEQELTLLQLSMNGYSIGEVVQYHPTSEIEGIQILVKLLENRYLEKT
jgi:hypothetical protein